MSLEKELDKNDIVGSICEDHFEPNSYVDFLVLLDEISKKYHDKLKHLKQLEETSLRKIEKGYKTIIAVDENANSDLPTNVQACDISVENIPTMTCLYNQNNLTTESIKSEPSDNNSSFENEISSRDKSQLVVDVNHGIRCKTLFECSQTTGKNESVEWSDDFVYNKLFFKLTSRYSPTNMQKEMWQKQITVPEPFALSSKHAIKENVLKTNCNNSVSNCKWIHPVPASARLPLYELMKNESENKRQERIKEHKEKLIATVQPFNLSSTRTRKQGNQQFALPEEIKSFRAGEIPKFLLSKQDMPQTNDLQDVLRKIRIKSRADEMLKKSALPFTGTCSSGMRRWKSTSILMEVSPHKAKSSEISTRNIIRKPTCSRQGHIYASNDNRTQRNELKHADAFDESQHSNECHLDKNTAFSQKSSLPTSTAKSKEIKFTRSALLRQEKVRELLNKKSEDIEKLLLKEESQKQKERQYHNEIAWKFALNDNLLYNKQHIKAKILSHRNENKMRELEYNEELQKMRERIQNSPTLLDKQNEFAARQVALRKIQSHQGGATQDASEVEKHHEQDMSNHSEESSQRSEESD